MKINRDEILCIFNENKSNNVICRPLESRPGEIAKYICGLANCEGGYIFIGADKKNGTIHKVGFLREFDMNFVMKTVCEKIAGEIECVYEFISISQTDIFVIKVEKSRIKIMLDDVFYYYNGKNDIEERKFNVLNKPTTLFISYTECDTPIVDIIESSLREKLKDKIQISRYTELQYKDSFKKFMDTIQDHDFVLAVVSDTYLKRQACMYEVGEIIKDHHYKNKLLFVVLSEKDRKYFGKDAPEVIAAKIYSGAQEKLDYISFWKEKYDKLNEEMNKIGDYEAIAETSKDLQAIGQIYRKDMGEFLKFLSDENGLNFQKLYENGFEDIVDWIKSTELT